MKNTFKYSAFYLILLLIISCNSNPSLQKYYVDSKENDQFISIDLPSSILQLKDENPSEELKDILETVKKVNFLAFQITDSNKGEYTTEKEKVNAILKNPKYKQLARVNLGKGAFSVNYLGDEDAIDEVVVFGSESSKGFALVRVLGENMNPANILKLAQKIKLNSDSNEINQLEGLMKSFK